ncbi:MAG: permease-like cell division protein FtsX [Oscillospiraceae bacterium]|jgi:cell division transport system permease protein
MKSNGLLYFLGEGFRSIFRRRFMSFAAICIIVACLILMGSFSLLAVNVADMLSEFQSESEILAYVDENLSEAEARSLGTKINQISNVKSAEFITREEALELFVRKYDNNPLFKELDKSALRDRYRIRLNDISLMEQTKNAIEDIPGIAKVNARLELSEGFTSLRNIVGLISVAMIIILLVISVFIISNTVKLTTFDRRDEIAIMKMVGATNSIIRWPFIFQGFFLGIFAAVIAFFAQWGIYILFTNGIASNDTLSLISVIPFEELIPYVAGVFGAVGFLIGVFGSATAIRKYLKV